jgi:prolyl oligopeptidase
MTGVRSLLALLIAAVFAVDAPKAPPTRVEPVKEVIHGVEVSDPYRWLEDQTSPETRAWIDVQNRYTESLLGSRGSLERLRRRAGELLRVETVSVPIERGGRYFFTRRKPDQNQAAIHMRKAGKDEALVDPNTLSADQTTSAALMAVSRDGRLLAYGLRRGGEDETTLVLLDTDARRQLSDRFEKARYNGVSFKPDRSGFYYTRLTAAGNRVYYHALGSDPARDAVVFGEGYNRDKAVSATLSPDGRYLFFSVRTGTSGPKTEIYFRNLQANGPVAPLVNDVEANFSGRVAGDHYYMQTNWKAPNGRILDVDLAAPARANWREVVPESDSVISGFVLGGGRLLVTYLKDVVSRLEVLDASGKRVTTLRPAELASIGAISSEWDKDEAFYTSSSIAMHSHIKRFAPSAPRPETWWQPITSLPSTPVEVKQVWYESKDRTRIPMFLAHRKDLNLDGSNPVFLTGYGGFTLTQTPSFRPQAALWISSGGVYALPNLRGGGEFGESWHRAGMFERKQNVFDDFISAAEWLIANRYTRPDRLAISGGSNGGLLVGAALTQRPELFAAVVCSFPLLDMVRYHKFLLGPYWVSEYGSADTAAQFPYIYAYSPYHRVRPGTRYPAVLFVTGDSDTRVAPLHARKMTALLQSATASDRPILLRYDTKAGHSGGLPVAQQIENLAAEFSFLFWQLSMEK